MNILITGGTGFVGPHLYHFLQQETPHTLFRTSREQNIPSEGIFSCDLRSEEEVNHVISQTKPDFIFHLAAQSSPRLSFSEPTLTHDTNVTGTHHLLSAVQAHVPQCRVLLISSSEVYGKPHTVPIPETAPLLPLSPYGASKRDEELLLPLFPNLHIVVARSFNHTGPGQSTHYVLPDFAMQIARIEAGLQDPVFMTGNTSAIRDFTDVRDMVHAYWLILTQGDPHQIYNIGSGIGRRLDHIIETLVTLSGKEIEIKTDPARMRPVDIPEVVADITRLQTRTGWKPNIPLQQTLADLIDHARNTLTS